MTILQPLLLVFVLLTIVADSVAVPGGMRSKKTIFKRGPAMSQFMAKHEHLRDTPTETATAFLETSTSNAVTADAAATTQIEVDVKVTTKKSFVRPAYFSMNRNNNDFNRDKSQHLILERRVEHELNKRKHHPPTLTNKKLTNKKLTNKNVALVETGSKMRLRGQTSFGPVMFIPGARDALASGLSAGYHG